MGEELAQMVKMNHGRAKERTMVTKGQERVSRWAEMSDCQELFEFGGTAKLEISKYKLTATENSLNPLSAERAELSFFFL